MGSVIGAYEGHGLTRETLRDGKSPQLDLRATGDCSSTVQLMEGPARAGLTLRVPVPRGFGTSQIYWAPPPPAPPAPPLPDCGTARLGCSTLPPVVAAAPPVVPVVPRTVLRVVRLRTAFLRLVVRTCAIPLSGAAICTGWTGPA